MYGVYQLVRAAPLQKTEGLPMRKKGRKKEGAKKTAQERGLCLIFVHAYIQNFHKFSCKNNFSIFVFTLRC